MLNMGELGEYWRDVKAHYKDRELHPEKYFTKKEITDYKKRCQKRDKQKMKSKSEIEYIAEELEIELITYPGTGQYSFGKVLDWWTTTGTAIARKTKERHHIGYNDTKKLREILITLIK